MASELERVAKALERIAANQKSSAKSLMEEMVRTEKEWHAERRAEWAVRFAAVASIAALLTAIGTLVIVLTQIL